MRKYPLGTSARTALLTLTKYLRLWGLLKYPGEIDTRQFPQHAPKVSIVLPTFNNAGITIRCINSIRQLTQESLYEIIVVDDGSNYFHLSRLRHLSGVKLVELSPNRGYIRACNAGSEHARGEILVLLNNDTLVTEGWLDALLDNFDDPQTGLVGSQLIYPTGVLQEAGGIVFADGSAANYGRGLSTLDPRVNFRREVDYCSGAAIAIRRSIFSQLGGYDERYTRAYYEDTDLAMSVRKLGFRVVFEPLSKIIHIEHASYDHAVGGTTESLMRENHKTFVKKWHSELQACFEKDFTRLDEAARRLWGSRGTILICDDFPRWKHDSGSRRLREIILGYRKLDYSIILVTTNPTPEEMYQTEIAQYGVQVWPHSHPGLVGYLKSMQNELAFAHVARATYAKFFIETLADELPNLKFAFDTVDLNFLRRERALQLKGGALPRRTAVSVGGMRQEELSLMNVADAVIVVSTSEKKLLIGLGITTEIIVVSNAHATVETDQSTRERSGILFVANFNHSPNADGLAWFLKHVHPQITATCANAELTVIGVPVPDQLISAATTQINALGWVDDIAPHYESARVVIAPLRYGAGVKGKIGEAWAHGVPVVMTDIGAEGMHVVQGETGFISDNPREFAQFVVDLMTNEENWLKISSNVKHHVAEHFSVKALRRNLTGIARNLDPKFSEEQEIRNQ